VVSYGGLTTVTKYHLVRKNESVVDSGERGGWWAGWWVGRWADWCWWPCCALIYYVLTQPVRKTFPCPLANLPCPPALHSLPRPTPTLLQSS